MLNKTLFAAGLLGLALSASQPALAGTKLVGYADLDLSTKDGQARLDARLRNAAKDVCGLTQTDLSAAELQSGRECFVKSLADARKAKAKAKLEQPTALAAAR